VVNTSRLSDKVAIVTKVLFPAPMTVCIYTNWLSLETSVYG
jgi:hypothetical protein